jgi:hypothetical protein
LKKPDSSKYYDSIIKNFDWLTNLVKAVKKTKLCDINKMNNYGIVNRNGKEELVLLDSGFTRDVFHKFYK